MRWLAVVAVLAGCSPLSPTIATDGFTTPTLLPEGMAVAVQMAARSQTIPGEVVHIDEGQLVMRRAETGAIIALTRPEVATLYRRPGDRLGMGFLAGGIVGGLIGWWGGEEVCSRVVDVCRPSYFDDRSTEKQASRVLGALLGAAVFTGIGQEADRSARGLDPSDWQEIEWPTGG